MPDHLTEALRTNRTGGKTVAHLLEAAAQRIAFMSMDEVRERVGAGGTGLVVLDIRERDADGAGHIRTRSTSRAAGSSSGSMRCRPIRRCAS